MESIKKTSVFLMLLIASSLSFGGLWHQLQGGSVFYTLIGLLYGLSFIFYMKKQEQTLYVNSALLMSIIVWASYLHKISFL